MFKRLFIKQKPVKLGRWAHNKFDDIVKKVDLANCDSCGTCGKSTKIKIKVNEKKLINSKNIKNEFLICNDDIIVF